MFPTAPVSVAVALADKIDMLTGFWAIDEKPTGSRDPFALRRAALGVIRLLSQNETRVGLNRIFYCHLTKAGQPWQVGEINFQLPRFHTENRSFLAKILCREECTRIPM